MPTDNAYKWAGIGYVAFCCVLFTWAGAHWLKNVRFDLLQGTKRVKLTEDAIAEGEAPPQGAPLSVPLASGAVLAVPATAHTSAGNPSPAASDVVVQVQPVRAVPEKRLRNMASASSQVPINSVLPFQPASFAFEHISYSVTVTETEGKQKGKTYDKELLHDVSGFVKPGQLVALMGSSGAGHTPSSAIQRGCGGGNK
jgi:ABC-type multidrug transport system fused ATPase/permease subunit